MYLLDTNALIILMFNDVTNGTLTEDTFQRLEEAEELFVSEISFWEMAIKIKLGKLSISQTVTYIAEQCRQNGICTIPVTVEQFAETMGLPLFKDHGDPFDRLILAVAKMKGMKVVSTDGKMREHQEDYGVEVVR